jgi:hypothetical protein
MRSIFELKKEAVTREFRKLHNEEFHMWPSALPSAVGTGKTGNMRKKFKILVEKRGGHRKL